MHSSKPFTPLKTETGELAGPLSKSFFATRSCSLLCPSYQRCARPEQRQIHQRTDGLSGGPNRDWLEMFAVAAANAARLAGIYLSKVSELQEEWRISVQRASRVRSDAAVWKLIDALPALPVVTLATAVIKVGRTKPAMNQAMSQLVSTDVLIPVHSGKRNRAWEARGLLDLMIGLESGEGT